jgi:hypothetical protein
MKLVKFADNKVSAREIDINNSELKKKLIRTCIEYSNIIPDRIGVDFTEQLADYLNAHLNFYCSVEFDDITHICTISYDDAADDDAERYTTGFMQLEILYQLQLN